MAKEEALPSAWSVTHGKGASFAECLECDTWQRRKHLQSAWNVTHDKGGIFAECLEFDTRQTRRDRLHSITLLFFAERRFQLSAKYLLSAR